MSTMVMERIVIVVQLADGTQLQLTPAEFEGYVLPEGARITLLDIDSGRAVDDLRMARQGDDLILSVDEEELVRLVDFYVTPDVAFFPDGDLSGDSVAQAIHSESEYVAQANGDTATDAGSVAGEGGTTGGGGLSTAGVIGGVAAAAGLAAAVGGSSGGGSSASAPEIPAGSVTVGLEDHIDTINRNNADAVELTGTTENIDEGTDVALVITDGSTEVTAETTVDAEGDFTATVDLSGLADGELIITASVIDQAGNEQTGNATVDHDSFNVIADGEGGLSLSGRHIYVEETQEGARFVNWRDFSADEDVERDGSDDQVVLPDVPGERDSVVVTEDISDVVIEGGLTVYADKAAIDNQEEEGEEGVIRGEGNLWLLVGDINDPAQTDFDAQLNIELSGGTLTFDMPSDDYELTLLDGSDIDLGGGSLEVSDGNIVLETGVEIKGAAVIVLNSSLVVSQGQIEGLGTEQVSGTGELIITVESDAEANEAFEFLTDNAELFPEQDGPDVVVRSASESFDDVNVDTADVDGSRNLFLVKRTDQLKAEIDAIVGEGTLTENLATLVELGAAVQALQDLVGNVTDSGGNDGTTVGEELDELQGRIAEVFEMLGPVISSFSVDGATGEISVEALDDVDGMDVTGVRIFDGETLVGGTFSDDSDDHFIFQRGDFVDGTVTFLPDDGVEVSGLNLTIRAVAQGDTGVEVESNAGSVFVTYSFDNVPPAAPVIETSDATTNATTQLVAGTAEAGVTVTLRDGTDVLGTAVANDDGAWATTIELPTDGDVTELTLTAEAVDAAGNVSEAAGDESDQVAFTIDQEVPEIEIVR
ncbi:Ig-like domain-containing protein, partial [Thioalkalivibrio sp. AKL12]|uniref:Ig-like domain-containing protein n=1 Tax=Thioalkalivibrio sp. AKL12 TaxID=1158159 RepID=UPI00035F5331